MKSSKKSEREVAVDGYDWFQRKFLGIEVGDVFSIPLPSGGYGFGRVLNAHDGATIAEFFNYWSRTPDFVPEILTAERLFSPAGFLLSGIAYRNRKRTWQVIHKDPDFEPTGLYDYKFSQSYDGYNWTYYTLRDHFKTLGAVNAKDVDDMVVPSILPQHPEFMANKIEELLKRRKTIV